MVFDDVTPNRYTSWSFMTMTIICINVMVMVFEDTLVETDIDRLIEVIYLYGTTPSLTLSRIGGGALSSITSTFLHGGLIHLVPNMLALWAFGRRVEDACGPWRFLLFYLVCGLLADVANTVVLASSPYPAIGASGAVYGIMGAYLILYPKGRLRLIVLFGWISFFSAGKRGTPGMDVRSGFAFPAIVTILFFLITDFAAAFSILTDQADYQVAHWAHLGGFFGSLFIFFFLRPDAFHRYRNDFPL